MKCLLSHLMQVRNLKLIIATQRFNSFNQRHIIDIRRGDDLRLLLIMWILAELPNANYGRPGHVFPLCYYFLIIFSVIFFIVLLVPFFLPCLMLHMGILVYMYKKGSFMKKTKDRDKVLSVCCAKQQNSTQFDCCPAASLVHITVQVITYSS